MQTDISSRDNESSKQWFFLTIAYIIIDYGRPQEIFPFIGTIRPLLLLTIGLSFFLIQSGPGFKLRVRQIYLLWAFAFLLACYVPFARNNFYAYRTALAQFVYMPFILSLIFCVDSFHRLKKLIYIFICLMIYISLYGISHGGRGPGNYFGDENDLCLYINMWLPFCYFFFRVEKGFKKKAIYLAGLIAGLAAVVISFSRGGFIGLLAMALVVWWFSKKKIAVTMIFLLTVLIMFLAVDASYWQEMSTVTDVNDNTANERILSWQTAWDMFLANPLGVGGNNFQVRFAEYQGDRFSRGMWGRVAHSLWFTLIPELGLVGITIYLSLMLINFKDILRLNRLNIENIERQKYFNCLGASYIASLAGYFAAGSFISVLYYAHYWYMTGLIVATVRIAKQEQ